MSTATGDRNPLDLLAEEFVARLRSGEPVTIAQYAERYPDRAEAIRELFPTLLEMERLKPRLAEATEDHHTVPVSEGVLPGGFGEFRILREIGRGGMGVVYEAVQESLGRHVALKVLPADSLADPKRRERFRREAKAAAKLHHTNIVPVFGTGEAAGLHYYAMQFIPGQGLDRVLADLRHQCAGHPANRSADETVALSTSQDAVPSSTTANSVLSGTSTPAGRPYWESVARLGVQAASGLAHAHAHGVLHRDIKPSNLLLDPQGTLWIADFGLAKLADEDDLTAAGDILGTLRYMAPERFTGQCDARADIYALGLTLYELATLRQAFDESGREKLIAQVTQGQPVRPSKLNPTIPRDLETIILKAIARDPAARYQTATELADDLQRFAEDRPIRARRVSAVERLWRWSRRNPVLAGLTATTALLLVAVAVSSTIAMLAYWNLAEQRREEITRSHQTNAYGEAGYRFESQGDYRSAVAAQTAASELSPNNSQVWSDRGTIFVRLALADEAAADFTRLFAVRQADNRPPNEPAWWYYQAALRLRAGDTDGYRAVCRGMQRHFPDAAEPEVVRPLVLACTLAPGGCDDPAELVRLVDTAAARHPTENFAGLRIAALYRAAEYREVIVATTPANPSDRSLPTAPLCFRTLSLAALGESVPAKTSLTAIREKLDAAASVLSFQSFGPDLADEVVGTYPRPKTKEGLADWLRDDLLWREATARVGVTEPEHPLPLFLRARGCAALGRWDEADAATARAMALCLGDEKAPRLAEVALIERARLNALRGRWTEVAADLERAGPLAPKDSPLSAVAAQLYSAHKRYPEARRHLALAVGQTPGNLDLRFERGLTSIKMADWDAAADDLGAILSDPRWTPMRRMSAFGGGALQSMYPGWNNTPPQSGSPVMASPTGDPRKEIREKIAQQEDLYARMITRRPGDNALKRERGRYLLAKQRWEEATALYTTWLATFVEAPRPGVGSGGGPFGLQYLGMNGEGAGPREIAQDVAPWPEVFAPLVKRWPAGTQLWLARSAHLLRNGQTEAAADCLAQALTSTALEQRGNLLYPAAFETEELFRAVAARMPADADLWLARVRDRVQLKDGPGAEATAREAARIRPENLAVCRDLANTFAPLYPEIALPYYRLASRLQAGDPNLHLQLFDISVRLKNWDEAAAAFDEALRLARLPAIPPNLGITVQAIQSRFPVDPEALEQLTRRRPENGALWLRYAWSLTRTKGTTAALEAFEKAGADPTTRLEAWTELVRIHLQLKHWDEAAAVLARADKMAGQPGQPPIPAAPIYYHSLSMDAEMIRELCQRRPQDAQLWLAASRQLAKAQQWKEAIGTLEKAGELMKGNPEVWTELGRLHTSQRNWKEAARAYDKALALLPPAPFSPLPHMARPSVQQTLYYEIVFTSFSSPDNRTLLTAVAELRPEDGRLWLEYCRFLTFNNVPGPMLAREAELRLALDELVRRSPKEPVAWLERATFRARVSEFDKAVDDYAAAADRLVRDGMPVPQAAEVRQALYRGVCASPAIFERFTANRKDDPDPWLFHSFLRQDKAGALADLERAIKMRPNNLEFQRILRETFQSFGEWDKAAEASIAEMKREEPMAGTTLWYEAAANLAAANRTEAYRDLCRRMEAVWKTPKIPYQCQQLAWAGGLLPESGIRPETLLELAETARKAEPRALGNVATVALAGCRLGQYDKVVPLTRESLKPVPFGVSMERLQLEFLAAIALAHDGKKDEARTHLLNGCKHMDEATLTGDQRRRLYPAHTWAACTVLRREAEKLLEEKP